MSQIKQNLKIYFLLLLIIFNVVIFYAIYYVSESILEVSFLDVGQGDAIFIKAPGGRQMLIDGGPNNSVLRELGKVMPFYDRSIDIVVATHADQDHIGGLIAILERFEVDLFIRTNATSSSAVYLELENLIKEKNIKTEIITAPEIITFGKDTKFNILFPNQNTSGWETNDSSIIGKLTYGQTSFLLTGDSPQIIEKYIVGKYGTFLDSDVLKVGHHGSKNSSAELFIGTVSPAYSVISAGINNSYGHPTPEVISILNNFSSQILKTFDKGMIQFKSDGKNLTLIKGNYP
jgi:competence protein ComEC